MCIGGIGVKLLPNYHYAIYKGYQALAAVYKDEIVFQVKLDINEKRLVIQTNNETTQNTISFNTILYLEYCLTDSNISKHRFFILYIFQVITLSSCVKRQLCPP